jgi:hypothetical protein
MKTIIDDSLTTGIAAEGSHVSHGVAGSKNMMRVLEE